MPKSGISYDERLEQIMFRTAIFLRSCNLHSDHVAREMGLTRGELAQAQYEMSRDLAETIEEEIKRRRKRNGKTNTKDADERIASADPRE